MFVPANTVTAPNRAASTLSTTAPVCAVPAGLLTPFLHDGLEGVILTHPRVAVDSEIHTGGRASSGGVGARVVAGGIVGGGVLRVGVGVSSTSQ